MLKTSYAKGVYAEKLAVHYLKKAGHIIRDQRYKTPYGEIDIVSETEDLIVFTEVKQRPTHSAAAYSLTNTQKKRLQNAGLVYTQATKFTKPCRFDVVLLDVHAHIIHLENVIWSDS